MLDPAAGDEPHVGVGVGGDELGDLVELVERAGELQQDEPSPLDEARVEGGA